MNETPGSGWYADPAGGDGLRFFDGQEWSSSTMPWPSTPSPAAPTRTATVVDEFDAGSSGDFFVQPRTSPEGLRGGRDAGWAPARPTPGASQRSGWRRPGVLAAAAGGIAVVVAAAVFLPGYLHPAAKPPKAITLTTPVSVNGWAQASDPQSAQEIQSLRQKFTDLSEDAVVAVYAAPSQNTGAIVFVSRISGDSDADKAIEDVFDAVMNGKIGPKLTSAPTAPYGGFTKCGVVSDDGPLTLCTFADGFVFGVIATTASGDEGVDQVRAIRRQVEIPTG